MKITISFDPAVDDEGEVHGAVERIFGGEVAPKETAAEKKQRLAEEKRAAKAAKEEETATAVDDEPDEPGITRDEVRGKLKEYAALEGKEAAIAILKDHGAASIGELDESKFAAVIEACGD